MFGLEKTPKAPFEFDLEKELRTDPTKIRDLLKKANDRIQEIKTLLRSGADSKEFDDLGVLLHGYTALQRVLNRINKKK
jgi:hypothetical protein